MENDDQPGKDKATAEVTLVNKAKYPEQARSFLIVNSNDDNESPRLSNEEAKSESD